MRAVQPLASKRFFDPGRKLWHVKILPGEFYVSQAGDEIVSTVLGSCISVTIFDPIAKLSGMNHFMLPASDSGEWAGVSASTRYGNFAMEHMINEALKRGAAKRNLVAHIFGGGAMLGKNEEIGRKNAKFAEDYLATERILVEGVDVGKQVSRKVSILPTTGRVSVEHLTLTNNTIAERELAYTNSIGKGEIETDVELF